MRERLDNARISAGRSLSEEIEHRLEQSFSAPERLAEIFGGDRNKRWDEDKNTRQLLMVLALKAISDLASRGSWQRQLGAALMGEAPQPEKFESELEQAIRAVALIEREKS